MNMFSIKTFLKSIRNKAKSLLQDKVAIESNQFVNLSYSQEGEDLLLNRFFENKNSGFYVDIGAHHPYRFSNTYAFYQKGWTGINIDPIPGIKKAFDLVRNKDINLEIAVSSHNRFLQYYNFKEKALNTFSLEIAELYQKNHWELENIIEIKTHRLDAILDKYLPTGTLIDFMTIDVEGFEMEVLTSNNWILYKPQIILVEILNQNLPNCEISNFLKDKGYIIVANTFNTVFFRLNNN